MIITSLVIVGLLILVAGFMAYNRILPIALGIHKPIYNTDNIALDGYDVTTYFKGTPIKGSSVFSTKFKDVVWYFNSEENMKLFMGNQEKYVPQFGGYCSKAVSTGFAAPADPTIFLVYENKLYIFSSEDVRAEFLKDPNGLITACYNKWK